MTHDYTCGCTNCTHAAIWLRASLIAESCHATDCEIFDGDYPCSCQAGEIGFRLRAQIPGSPEAERAAKEAEESRYHSSGLTPPYTGNVKRF